MYYNDSIPSDPQNTGTYGNYVFKVQRYAPTYPGLIGKDLTPGGFIELYPSGIENTGSSIPDKFELSQNYPNPFNPTTNINFSISNAQFVTLKIYDMLGKEIATLVNEKLNAGSYKVNWNASAISSGVYYYRITAGNFVETKKMILLK